MDSGGAGMSEKSDWEKGYDQAMMRTYGERKALKARIAELEAERRWIPVSERLPEGSGHYIVFDDHGDIMSCEFLADYKGEPLWDDDDGVLYWMPLPEPPEVE